MRDFLTVEYYSALERDTGRSIMEEVAGPMPEADDSKMVGINLKLVGFYKWED